MGESEVQNTTEANRRRARRGGQREKRRKENAAQFPPREPKVEEADPSSSKVDDRKPARLKTKTQISRRELMEIELTRLSSMEGNAPSNPKLTKKEKHRNKAKLNEPKRALSNKNLSIDDEFIFENLTAFVFQSHPQKIGDNVISDRDLESYGRFTDKQVTKDLRQSHVTKDSSSELFKCRICLLTFPTTAHALFHIYKNRYHKNLRSQLLALSAVKLARKKFPLEDNPDRLALLNAELESLLVKRQKATDFAKRIESFDRLEAILKKFQPEIKVQLYGSTAYKTPIETSDINVCISKEGLRSNILLSHTYQFLKDLSKEVDSLQNVKDNFYVSTVLSSVGFTPHIQLTDVEVGVKITIVGAEHAETSRIKTANLIKFYLEFEPRIHQIALIFRQWANWCGLDEPDNGTLPSYCFVICVIFFFQSKKWCPVLHSLTECRLPELPVRFENDICFYRPIKSKNLSSQDDGEMEFRNESDDDLSPEEEPTTNEPETVEAETTDDTDTFGELDSVEIELERTCPKELSLAMIFIELFEFFGFTFNMEAAAIGIRHTETVPRVELGWGAKRMACMDPYQSRNICRSMSSQGTFDYFVTRLRATYGRLFIGANELRQMIDANKNGKRQPEAKRMESDDVKSDAGLEVFVEDGESELAESLTKLAVTSRPRIKVQLDPSVLKKITNYITADKRVSSTESAEAEDISQDLSESTEGATDGKADSDAESDQGQIDDETADLFKRMNSVFDKDNIAGGPLPARLCSLCRSDEHVVSECPDDISRVQLEPLPELSPTDYHRLDSVLIYIWQKHRPKERELQQRERALKFLQNYMEMNFDKNARLDLFGSSRNGFGFSGSDLDICLTFAGHDDEPPELYNDPVDVIKNVAAAFKNNQVFGNIVAITQAKVPIVKFELFLSNCHFEGDISYYNVLAKRNTKMLLSYAKMDKRCEILGYVIKAMVKEVGIGDASRGSLSSYAYILMVIHFLQQEGILPVLQELHDEEKQPEHIVEGYNTWFQEDQEIIDRKFKRTNDACLSMTWIKFLRYYTEEFKYDRAVIQCRIKQQITLFEKEWTSKCISIEDPFDLSHNLGCGVSRKMANYIIKVFRRGRLIFGGFNYRLFEEKNLQIDNPILGETLLGKKLLTNGEEVPNDRCCKICGKIGHFVKDCPMSKKNRRLAEKNGVVYETPPKPCFVCNEVGHIKKDCPRRQSNRDHQRNQPRRHQPHGQHYERGVLLNHNLAQLRFENGNDLHATLNRMSARADNPDSYYQNTRHNLNTQAHNNHYNRGSRPRAESEINRTTPTRYKGSPRPRTNTD